MDVTRDNFNEALTEFHEAIACCDFAAIDMEMTGLYENRDNQPNRLDSMEKRYKKLKRSVESYGVVQVGLCMFTWIEDEGYYEARPFNFNVFPCTNVGGMAVETHFGCKNTAIEFLAKNSFDFNKWVYKSVPYLKYGDADNLLKARVEQLTSRGEPAEVDKGQIEFVRELKQKVAVFIMTKQRTMCCETANSYQRKLVHSIVGEYDNLGTRGRNGNIEIYKGTKKALAQQVQQKLQSMRASITEARGFCAVIDALSASQKPVVGHNMLLDILHAYSKFYEPLPQTHQLLERAMARFLPMMIDTKYVIESTLSLKNRYRTSNLDEIAPMLETEANRALNPTMIRNHPKFPKDFSSTESMHEAGADAYMTGATLIRLLKLEGGLQTNNEMALHPYINKVYVALEETMSWDMGQPLVGGDLSDDQEEVEDVIFYRSGLQTLKN